ncbi:death domain-containing protein 1-like [Watersipora subatra]|uniref:death domain-containing protein 1-like n=1 Tax=Watersipora subatra TaxID=2589382 RepID=UPI00355C8AAC
MSVQARQTAEEAARKAEVAEKAAKEKARLEEDKRQKAEALAKKQAEEEKAKKELEEKRRIEMEKIKGTPEEQERRNPNNWPSYTFKQTASNDFDGSYACIIRAMPGLLAQNDVAVEKINQLNSGLTLDNNDELVGNIVSINPVADNDGQAIFNSNELMSDSDEPLSILLPHCAPRSTSRELIVMWRQFQDADWVPLEAKECNLESVKEAKLVECRPRGLGVFAPIFRLKTDNHVITKKGGKFTSSVDGRLCVQCRPGSFRVNTPFTMQVQPVDLASVSDVKVRFPEECGGIISSSSIIKMEFPTPTLKRAINIITPIPANSARPKRPMTAVDKERAKPPTRPASAFGLGTYNKEEEEEDALHLLTLDSDGNWYITNQMEFSPQNKKGDLISVTTDIIPHKYWLLRTKASLSTSQVEAMADRLYDYIHRRLAQFIVRQKADDPTDIALVCVPSQKVDKTIRKLDEEGYTDCNKISQEIFVKEGQKLEVRFRGNLQPDEEVDLITSFNSQLKCQINLYIAEIDKYAQKTLSSYRGFAQFFTEGMVTKDIYDESDKKKEKKPIGSEEVWDSIKLAELLISLPKPEQEAPKPLKKAKLNLIPEGPIDEALLKQLSSDLGDEWKMLASHLNVKKTRIQSIMRNHVNSESDGPIQEMLLTWIKRIPRSMDKVKVLCDALRAVGRLDLVEDVRDKEYDFNELRAELYKENLLRQIFVKIAQHHSGLARWKDIAQHLRVTDQELSNIEDEFSSGRERCLEALEIWKQNQGANASPQQLVRAVKYYRLNDLAGEIRRLINQ